MSGMPPYHGVKPPRGGRPNGNIVIKSFGAGRTRGESDLPIRPSPSDLPPARHPGAVLNLVVREQGRRLSPHEFTDLVEDQPDLLLRAGRRARLDGVPERADVGGPGLV